MIDASVAVKWVIPEPFADRARTLLEADGMYAPAHWLAEAVNAVRKRASREQLSADDARECASTLVDAPVTPVPLSELLMPAMDLAIRLRISIYDALYVALAAGRQIPLITDDRTLLMRMATEPTLAPLALPLEKLPEGG
ncbi:MAG TPA: type II toxin-antitoxin system VapC family toxin [Acetobacteraceae bacterium]|nr:type II toxin-antitoxin system VapC family toxin [Acetobacteraceae bacterium]